MTFDKKCEDTICAIPNPLFFMCKFRLVQEGQDLNPNEMSWLSKKLLDHLQEKTAKKYVLFPFNENNHWFLMVLVNPALLLKKSDNHQNCAMLVMDSQNKSKQNIVVYKYRDFLCNLLQISNEWVIPIHIPVKYKQLWEHYNDMMKRAQVKFGFGDPTSCEEKATAHNPCSELERHWGDLARQVPDFLWQRESGK